MNKAKKDPTITWICQAIASIGSATVLFVSINTRAFASPSLAHINPSNYSEVVKSPPEAIPPPLLANNFIPPQGYSPPPFEDSPSNPFNRYLLNVGDDIGVAVLRFPEFNFRDVIDAEGNILMPIVGRISVVGLTLKEVEEKISEELNRRYLKEKPEVVVNLINPRVVELTITGEIIRPGYYIVSPGTPLTNILQFTGGATSAADLRSIIVGRRLIDGTVIQRTVDLYTPLLTGKKLPTVRLQGGDTIQVSRLQVGADRGYDRTLVARTALVQRTITIRVLSYPTQGIGTINVPNGSTFLDIIGSIAPNPDNANLDEIALMRFDPERRTIITQTLDGERAIRGDISQNIPLQDEDVIVVGRSLVAKVNFTLRTLSEPVQTFFGFRALFQGLTNILPR